MEAAQGFKKQEVVTSFDDWKRSTKVVPVGAIDKKSKEPEYGYLNFEDPGDQGLIDFADAYLKLKENGIDIRQPQEVSEEGDVDWSRLKLVTQLFADPGAKEKIHRLILSCFPEIRRVCDEAKEVYLTSGGTEDEFVPPLDQFKPFRKLALLSAAGQGLSS